MDTLASQVDFIGAIGNTHCALAPGAMEPLQSAHEVFPRGFRQRHIDGGACPCCDGGAALMPSIHIDGMDYEVEAGKNLLETCLSLGLDLPYFCWHPAMGSVGACRQCARGAVPECRGRARPHRHGLHDAGHRRRHLFPGGDKAQQFREAIVESLMLNHPHDCPVCAEGGECHLQDMTVMVGHRDRHYRGRKNTHRNQYLGPLINHEMNRCITCYRCTRYYRDYAGGTDLAAMAAHDHVYFGRHQDGVLESEFAGNLVEVCPTGVFTDKTLVHDYTRKWDLQSAPSVCTGCAVGCNTMPGERYGRLKRVHNRFNAEVNGYFLCDRGRFGAGFVNSEQRLEYPDCARRTAATMRWITTRHCKQMAAGLRSGGKVAGIGSPRASVEANYLLRTLVGGGQFRPRFQRCGTAPGRRRQLQLQQHSPAVIPDIETIESADAILILGEDVTNTRTAHRPGPAPECAQQGLRTGRGAASWNPGRTPPFATSPRTSAARCLSPRWQIPGWTMWPGQRLQPGTGRHRRPGSGGGGAGSVASASEPLAPHLQQQVAAIAAALCQRASGH